MAGGSLTLEARLKDHMSRELGRVRKEMKKTATAGKKMGTATKGASTSAGGLSKNMGGLAGKLKGGAIFAVAAMAIRKMGQELAEAAEKAGEFEVGMSKVATMLDETTMRQLPDLGRAVQGLAGEYNRSAADIQGAMFQTLSAGVDAAESVEFLRVAATASVGGFTSMETAVDGLTNIVNAYGLETAEAGAISDAIFAANKYGKTTFEEIAQGIGKVAPTAALLGIGFDELSAAIASVTKQGVKTTQVITGIRSTLVAILKPTKDAEETAAKLGIEFGEAALKAQGLQGFLTTVKEAVGDNTTALSKLFGNVRALGYVSAQTSKGGLADMATVLKDIEEGTTTASSAAAKAADDHAFAMGQMEKRQDAAVVQIGIGSQRYVKFYAEMKTGLLEWLAENERQAIAFNDELRHREALNDIYRLMGGEMRKLAAENLALAAEWQRLKDEGKPIPKIMEEIKKKAKPLTEEYKAHAKAAKEAADREKDLAKALKETLELMGNTAVMMGWATAKTIQADREKVISMRMFVEAKKAAAKEADKEAKDKARDAAKEAARERAAALAAKERAEAIEYLATAEDRRRSGVFKLMAANEQFAREQMEAQSIHEGVGDALAYMGEMTAGTGPAFDQVRAQMAAVREASAALTQAVRDGTITQTEFGTEIERIQALIASMGEGYNAAVDGMVDANRKGQDSFNSFGMTFGRASKGFIKDYATVEGASRKFGGAVSDAMTAMIVEGASASEAFKQVTHALLTELAQRATVEAIYNLAKGIAAAVTPGMQGSAIGFFAAAAMFGSIAGVAAYGAHATKPAKAKEEAAGEEPTTPSTLDRGRDRERERGGQAGGVQQVIIQAHFSGQPLVNKTEIGRAIDESLRAAEREGMVRPRSYQ